MRFNRWMDLTGKSTEIIAEDTGLPVKDIKMIAQGAMSRRTAMRFIVTYGDLAFKLDEVVMAFPGKAAELDSLKLRSAIAAMETHISNVERACAGARNVLNKLIVTVLDEMKEPIELEPLKIDFGIENEVQHEIKEHIATEKILKQLEGVFLYPDKEEEKSKEDIEEISEDYFDELF